MKKINYRHFIGLGLLAGSIACSVLFFPYALGRLLEALRDVGTSFGFYFDFIVDKPTTITPTVTNRTTMPFELPWNLPNTWEEFKVAWTNYWTLWGKQDNFNEYLSYLTTKTVALCKTILIVMPVLFGIVLIKNVKHGEINNDYGQNTPALKRFIKFIDKTKPIRQWFVDLFLFFKQNRFWIVLCCWCVLSVIIVYFAMLYVFNKHYTKKNRHNN